MKSETKDLTEELNDGLISIQKVYDRRRAQLEENISALERQHAEWLSLNNGEKLLRLKLVAAAKENGEIESVYSERVKLRAKDIIAELEKKADAARKRLAATFGSPETSPGDGQS